MWYQTSHSDFLHPIYGHIGDCAFLVILAKPSANMTTSPTIQWTSAVIAVHWRWTYQIHLVFKQKTLHLHLSPSSIEQWFVQSSILCTIDVQKVVLPWILHHDLQVFTMDSGWLVVWNMFDFPIQLGIGNHHPNWLIIFQRGRLNHQPAIFHPTRSLVPQAGGRGVRWLQKEVFDKIDSGSEAEAHSGGVEAQTSRGRRDP